MHFMYIKQGRISDEPRQNNNNGVFRLLYVPYRLTDSTVRQSRISSILNLQRVHYMIFLGKVHSWISSLL